MYTYFENGKIVGNGRKVPTTYAQLGLPSARVLRSAHYDAKTLGMLKAHNREMLRKRAFGWNWGWVITAAGIATKTNQGILCTDIHNGDIKHLWTSYENHHRSME